MMFQFYKSALVCFPGEAGYSVHIDRQF